MGDSLRVSKRNSQLTIEKKNLILYGSNTIKDDECMGGMMGKLEVIHFQTHCILSSKSHTHTHTHTPLNTHMCVVCTLKDCC